MRGVTRLKRSIRNIKRLLNPVAAILIYHRIVDLQTDPFRIIVSPKNFASHLEYIREKYIPMSLSELANAMRAREVPHRAVVVTFDDGYGDNLYQALPLLEYYQVPGTIFVASHPVSIRQEFWWDDLERILLSQAYIPDVLRLTIEQTERIWPTANPKERQQAFEAIYAYLRSLPAALREKVLCDLAAWAGISRYGRPENLPMTIDELRQISRNKYIEIGAHTRTHPVLSTLKPDEQYAEIISGREELESILGKKIETFSYPFGNSFDFTDQSVKIVQAAGFQAAVTTIQGAVDINDNLYRLRRCEVNNWDISKFQKKLASFFYT